MRSTSILNVSTLTLTLALLGLAAGCSSQPKPELTISEIMTEGFKGKTSMAARLSENMGTQSDKMRMAYLTQQLALNTPPKGEVEHWVMKTANLNHAAVSLESDLPGALGAWQVASDCKKCHTEHKPD